MTKEEFEVLQLDLQRSGKSIKSYLRDAGIGYSTYNYWRKKFAEEAKPRMDLVPISFTGRQQSDPGFTGVVPSGATLLFPNGLRAHFGSGTEGMLMEVLTKSLESHVLPECAV